MSFFYMAPRKPPVSRLKWLRILTANVLAPCFLFGFPTLFIGRFATECTETDCNLRHRLVSIGELFIFGAMGFVGIILLLMVVYQLKADAFEVPFNLQRKGAFSTVSRKGDRLRYSFTVLGCTVLGLGLGFYGVFQTLQRLPCAISGECKEMKSSSEGSSGILQKE